MHSFPVSNKTVYKTFPKAETVTPGRDARRAPSVTTKDVPESLRSVPGSQRDRAQEAFFARHYPEQNFKLGVLNQTYHHVVEAAPGQVSQTYRILAEKYGDLIPRVNELAWTFHEKPAAEPRALSANLTEDIRRKALSSGADLVGFTRFDRRYVPEETRPRAKFKHVIVLCRAFDWATTNRVPSVDWDVHSYDTSLALMLAAIETAEFIRSHGYRVQFMAGTGLPGEKMVAPILPYAIEAGLGQMGANGTMLTPEYGSRVRVVGLSTDAPVTLGRPVDFGINVLCDNCQICVKRCPGRALSTVRVNWHGVMKYKVVSDRCLPMLRYAECNVCTKVCPVQHFGLKRVLDHWRETGMVLGKGTEELERYSLFEKGSFGPGELPHFETKEGAKGLMKMADELGVEPAPRASYDAR
jgi:epoxyqueuosine reductase QueG